MPDEKVLDGKCDGKREEQKKRKKRYLIAGATVIVPDREVRDRFWHLQVGV